MRKLKKFAAWTLAVAMVLSLFAGVGQLIPSAKALSASTISETYPEATELMISLGLMNGETPWTDPASMAEVNAAIDALLYAGLAQYEWCAHNVFVEGEAITGSALINKALGYLVWGGGLDEQWTTYFHLTRGIANYDGNAVLTREQAAQIINNALKANPSYNPACIKGQDTFVNLVYEKVSSDALGRPSYQWKREGVAMTSVYAAEPIAVLEGGTDWELVMDSVGLTSALSEQIANPGYWSQRQMNYRVSVEGSGFGNWQLAFHGSGAGPCYAKGWVIEIYDSYYMPGVDVGGNVFNSRGYDVLAYCNLLAEVRVIDGLKKLNMYGQPNGYGWWYDAGLSATIENCDEGFYIVNYAGAVLNPRPATVLCDTLTGFNQAAGIISVGGQDKFYSTRFHQGYDLMIQENIGKDFFFMLDPYGNVVGMFAHDHGWSEWTFVDGDSHKRVCDCGKEETGAHAEELRGYVAPTIHDVGYSGDLYCSVCNALLKAGQELPKATCDHTPGEPVRENEVAPTCEGIGGYDTVTYCSVCQEELTRVHTPLDPIGHKWHETGREEPGDDVPGSVTYVCENDETHTKTEVLPAKNAGKTAYPEAVAVVKALGVLNPADDIWTTKITGAEVNAMLKYLYDGPGFVNPWSPNLDPNGTVSGKAFISGALVTIGWNYNNDTLWGAYNNLEAGLVDYNSSKDLTREQAAQLFLNTLKSIPTYNPATLKANDPAIGLVLVMTGRDSLGRPSYKWQKAGADITGEFLDTPISKLRGGCTWNDILNSIHYVTDPGVPVAQFRWIIEGADATDFVGKVHPDESVFLDDDYVLEVYYDFTTDRNGYEYTIVCYKSDEEIEEENTKTNSRYPEAIQLLVSLGWLDGNITDWSKPITGEQANFILQKLYDGPGFINPWAPDFSPNGSVTGAEFISDALVTIGWNYNNDALWGAYNHLEKGLKSDYKSTDKLSLEEAAQITLNTLKAIPVYNTSGIKANDPGIGLTLVKVKTDSLNRPYYKWVRGNMEMTEVWMDTPVAGMQGGVTWGAILNSVGNVGDANFQQFFRISDNGGAFSEYEPKMHINENLFLDEGTALEIYLDYNTGHGTYAYSIITYPGELDIPETGDSLNLMFWGIVTATAAAAAFVMLAVDKKRKV